jgi:hypothetical protein
MGSDSSYLAELPEALREFEQWYTTDPAAPFIWRRGKYERMSRRERIDHDRALNALIMGRPLPRLMLRYRLRHLWHDWLGWRNAGWRRPFYALRSGWLDDAAVYKHQLNIILPRLA